MGPVLPAVQKRNYASELSQGISSALNKYMEFQQREAASDLVNNENEALLRQDIDLRGISDPKLRHEISSNKLKQGNLNQQSQQKQNEKIAPLKSALGRVKKMKEIGNKGNLGWGSSVTSLFSGDARKDMGAYETLGKSLISFISSIPIRNKSEFETLAHGIYDATISDAKREGILNELETIIQDSLNDKGDEDEFSGERENPKKNRPDISTFMRQ